MRLRALLVPQASADTKMELADPSPLRAGQDSNAPSVVARAARPVKRIAERVSLSLVAEVRPCGQAVDCAQLQNLSTHGFRIETHLHLWTGATLWLRLPSLESRSAQVAWTNGEAAGCAFEVPLHPAVLDMIVTKARTALPVG